MWGMKEDKVNIQNTEKFKMEWKEKKADRENLLLSIQLFDSFFDHLGDLLDDPGLNFLPFSPVMCQSDWNLWIICM